MSMTMSARRTNLIMSASLKDHLQGSKVKQKTQKKVGPRPKKLSRTEMKKPILTDMVQRAKSKKYESESPNIT